MKTQTIARFLKESNIAQVQRAYRFIESDLAKELRVQDLSLIQALVLVSLHLAGEKLLIPSEIAEAFSLSRSQVSQILSHLEEKHFIKRVIDVEDARSLRLKLRPERKKIIALIINAVEKTERNLENFLRP